MADFYMGHHCLGDSICLCAAAHLYSNHVGKTVTVNFWEPFKNIASWFDGVKWIPTRDGATDVGADPKDWSKHNGVSRFLHLMGLNLPIESVNIEFNHAKADKQDKILITTHGNKNGNIDKDLLRDMILKACKKYQGCSLEFVGQKDNKLTEFSDIKIKDSRTDDRTCQVIMEQIRHARLVIGPHNGIMYIPLGLGVEVWCQNSKNEAHNHCLEFANNKPAWWKPKKLTLSNCENVYLEGVGVGDIIGTMNMLQNLREQSGNVVNLYVRDQDKRLRDLHALFEVPNVRIGKENKQDLQSVKKILPWGSDSDWVTSWLRGAGCKEYGPDKMIKMKIDHRPTKGKVGISFSVHGCPGKNVALHHRERIINKLLNNGKEIVYFGYRKDDPRDAWVSEYSNNLKIASFDFENCAKEMATCEEFIGADSGMAWVSTFLRIPTTIVVGVGYLIDPHGHGFGLPKTFNGIPHVNIKWDYEI